MNKKTLIIMAIAVIVAAGLAFYGGMQYGQSAKTAAKDAGAYQQRGSTLTGGVSGMNNKTGQGFGGQGGFFVGEIISREANMLTIKLNNGGTSLILLSASTTVSKYSAAAQTDLIAGEQIAVTGDKTVDGSVSAKSIQIQPTMIKPQG